MQLKGRLFLALFALPFAGVGVWAGYSIGSTLYDAWRMQHWATAPATLADAGYRSHQGDDATTYEAYAVYTYEVNGQRYEGNRVGLERGADNIGDYQVEIAKRLSAAWTHDEPVTIHFDPSAPGDSIIDPGVRWGMVAFKGLFLLVFGAVGFGLLIYAVRARKPVDRNDSRFEDNPWLARDGWQTRDIRSGSKATMWVAWGFAGFWNLVSAPLPFLLYDEIVVQRNWPALFGLLFPLVGIGLLVWAVRQTREWTRFGAAPVSLDPFPGAIGGHVGGHIDINMPYPGDATFNITLTSMKSYESGSGKNRSRREKALWQDEQRVPATPGPSGTRMTFRFDVPEGLQASDAERRSDSYFLWRLSVHADLTGADFNRDYDIPVYPTAALSAALPERLLNANREQQDRSLDDKLRRQLNIGHGLQGPRLHLPVGRNLASAAVAFVVGAAFAGAGVFIVRSESAWLFGGIFAAIGGLVALGALYAAANSLTVSRRGTELHTVRRILGIPVSRKSMPIAAIRRYSTDSNYQAQSGKQFVMHYNLQVHDGAGNRMTVVEGLRGESEARVAKRILADLFGLPEFDRGSQIDEHGDILAADH